jgi:phage-related holin
VAKKKQTFLCVDSFDKLLSQSMEHISDLIYFYIYNEVMSIKGFFTKRSMKEKNPKYKKLNVNKQKLIKQSKG